jgi:hypothetical protein
MKTLKLIEIAHLYKRLAAEEGALHPQSDPNAFALK